MSAYRLFVSNGKAGLVSGLNENAHLFDLLRIGYVPGDCITLVFKKLTLVIDDTVGTQLVTKLWETLLGISYEVPHPPDMSLTSISLVRAVL